MSILFSAFYFLLDGDCGGDELVVGHVVGEPVDVGAAAFHASEPGHLSLGELVDGCLELGEHLVIGELPNDMECQVLAGAR